VGDQHHLRLLRHIRHRQFAHPGRAGPGHQHPGLEGLQRRLPRPGSRRLCGAVGDPDVRGHRGDRRAVPLHRAAGALLMVENRPFVTFISHLVLILGVLVIAFPVWMTFVASTHDQATMLRSPVPLLPGPHLIDNYRQILFEGYGRGFSDNPTWLTLVNSLIMAVGVAGGEKPHSSISAFSLVSFPLPPPLAVLFAA